MNARLSKGLVRNGFAAPYRRKLFSLHSYSKGIKVILNVYIIYSLCDAFSSCV